MNDENTLVNGTEKNQENVGADAAAQTSSDRLPATHSRIGKIARLPQSIRDQLNRRLRDGQPGKQILDWLNAMPEVQAVMADEFHGQPITKQNLSHWRVGGYLEAQEIYQARQDVRSLLEEVVILRESAKGDLTEQLVFYLSVRAALELKRMNSVPHGEERTKFWREIRTGVVALRRGDIDLERLRLQREKYGLSHKSKDEKEAEFWKWADENINRDEFCRRRCFTREEREAAINKILGITPEERGEIVPLDTAATPGETGVTESSQESASQA